MKNAKLFTIAILCFFGATSNAQGIMDGFDSEKGKLSLTTSYTYQRYKEFYAGKSKKDAVPVHNKITQNILSIYAKYGITSKLTAIANVPYIIAEGDGAADPVNGKTDISDFQNISLALKYNAYKQNFDGGNLNILTGAGVDIPTGYESNGILALGNGAFSTNVLGGLHLNTNWGVFATLTGTYSFKGDVENEGNVGNGFTEGEDFDAPNTFSGVFKTGYASSLIYVEAWAELFRSEKGIDIGAPEFANNFPETKVEHTRVGATIYKNIIPEIGASLGFSKIVDGRNIGKGTSISLGITLNLDVNK